MHKVLANYGCGAERKKMVYYCKKCKGKFNDIKDPKERQKAIREEFGTLPNLCVDGSMRPECPYAKANIESSPKRPRASIKRQVK